MSALLNPKLSIITPVLNGEQYIAACILSVASQTYKNIEHIIVDGSSTDGTLDIVKKYAQECPHIRWVSAEDRNAYDAMNKSIGIARGDWLYFLGADDKLYNEDVIERIFLLKLTLNVKIIYGNVLVKGKCVWAKDGQVYDGPFTISHLITRSICHQAIFYHKDVFKKFGFFNTKYSVCADWDFNLRVWAKCKLFYTDTIVTVFQGGGISSMHIDDFTEIEKWKNIIKYYKLKILGSDFTPYREKFLMLIAYFERKNYILSCILRLVLYFHKIRFILRNQLENSFLGTDRKAMRPKP